MFKIKVLSGFSVEYLGDNRNEDSLDGYFGKLSPKRREKIESIAVDMWDPYLASIRKHVPDAEVRKAESREMVKNNNERLKGTKCLCLYSKENAPKEETGWLWAEKHFKAWFFWATHLKLAPVITAAWTFKRHLDHILNYVQHRITNAVSEGLNSKVQTIKKKAYGFRNRESFKTSIFFHCDGLILYPVTHKNV